MIVGREVTAAMKLQDLYYGNVIPCQHDVRQDSDYAKRSLELLEMCDTLEKRLSADDKWSCWKCATHWRNGCRLTTRNCLMT